MRELAMHAAEAAGRHHAMPERAHGRQRAADGRRAERSLHAAGGEVARADLAGGAPRGEAPQLRLASRPTTTSPSRMPTVAGTAPAARTAASEAAPTPSPRPPGTRARPASSRGRRPPGRRKRVEDLAGDPQRRAHPGPTLGGIAPTVVTQRAAAASPLRSADATSPPRRKPAASASPAPVESTT